MLLTIFIFAVFLFIYPLLIYPILVTLLARIFPEPVKKSTLKPMPFVTLIIPAHNEEAVIEEKIQNSLDLRYPLDRIEILVASDGSIDRTVELLEKYSDVRLRVFPFSERRGKLPTLIDVVGHAKGEILVFSDASAILAPDAIDRLMENFSDQTVGCVSGRYLIQEDMTPVFDGRSSGERGYFEFEVFQRRQESLFHSTLGAHGALYALRRCLFPKVSPGVINDDFVIPMMVLAQGFRTVYEQRAVVMERHQTNVKGEFRRRIRISHGNFQQIFLLLPFFGYKDLKASFVFWSHKIIRAFQPVYLGLILVLPLLIGGRFFTTFFEIQVIFYLLGVGSLFLRRPRKFLAIPLYFVLGNAAIVGGFFRQISQRRRGEILQWEKS